MSQRVLFISSFIGQNHSGGSAAGQRNLALCKELFTGFEVDAYGFAFTEAPLVQKVNYLPSHKSKLSTFVSYFLGYAGSLTPSNVKTLIGIFKKGKYKAVFLDGSLLGKLAKKFKQIDNRAIICTFFHNIEKHFFKAKLATNPLWLPLYFSACKNEKLSARYSNYLLCFNERDANNVEKIYNRKVIAKLPVTIEDKLDPGKCSGNGVDEPLKLLFIGSDFFGNTQGIKWFIKNVMPNTNAILTVAGKGMERYKTEWQADNVVILGTVDSVAALYCKADIVVAPIFSGAGMKIKIAEALMMGKNIAGTTEAWQGYLHKETNASFVCNTAEDFLGVFNSKKINTKFNNSARDLYLKYYSPASQQGPIKLLQLEIIKSFSDGI